MRCIVALGERASTRCLGSSDSMLAAQYVALVREIRLCWRAFTVLCCAISALHGSDGALARLSSFRDDIQLVNEIFIALLWEELATSRLFAVRRTSRRRLGSRRGW